MKRYGYHRTSTREQHLDRGIKEITAYCEQNNLELEKIFTDQQTGKNFNRPRYVFCQALFPEKSVRIPCFRQGNFPAFGGAQLRIPTHEGMLHPVAFSLKD